MTETDAPHRRPATEQVHDDRILSVLGIGSGWFPDDPGGLERVFYALATHLPDFGIRFHALVTGAGSLRNDTRAALHPFAPPDAGLPRRWLKLRHTFSRLTATETIDLFTAHFALYALPVIRRIGDMPFVYHFHGPWASESAEERPRGASALLKHRIEGAVYRRADCCIVLSNAFKQLLCERYGVDESSVHVIPGGVDISAFDTGISRTEARQQLGWPADRPTVLCVRRLVRRMGLENLIAAAGLVKQSVPDLLVYIAGKGPLEGYLGDLIRERGLENNVRLLGFVPDETLPVAYRAADLSIVPTLALEGFGLITLESLAAGTPVLVTPVGGLPETVQQLSEDLLLEGTAPEQIADGLKDALLGKRSLPTDEACREYVRRNHDWRVIARRTAERYRAVLS